MKSLVMKAGLLLCAWMLGMGTVNAAPRVLKAGIGLNADTPQGQAMAYFAQLVEKKSGGRLAIDLQVAGALGDDVSMVSALQSGKQDITCPDSSTLAKQVSDFSAINYPFTFLSEQEADGILDGPWGQRLLGKLSDKGLVGLAFWENGFRHLTNSKRPLPTLAATQGIRMRTMQNQMLIDTFGLLGFEPVPLPFTKVYAALSQQTVDGQENPLPTILSSRFYEVQKYLTLSRHVYSAFVLLIGKSTWDSLSREDQAAIAQAASEARDMQRRTNRAATAAALEQLKARGMQITSIDVRESERVRNKLRPVLEKYHRQIGERTVLSMYVELSQARATQQPGHGKSVQ